MILRKASMSSIYSTDLRTLTLTLNQGMEHLRKSLGDAPARAPCGRRPSAFDSRYLLSSLTACRRIIDLASRGARPCAPTRPATSPRHQYATSDLPTEVVLADLDRFLRLYSQSVEAKRTLLLVSGFDWITSGTAPSAVADPLRFQAEGRFGLRRFPIRAHTSQVAATRSSAARLCGMGIRRGASLQHRAPR